MICHEHLFKKPSLNVVKDPCFHFNKEKDLLNKGLGKLPVTNHSVARWTLLLRALGSSFWVDPNLIRSIRAQLSRQDTQPDMYALVDSYGSCPKVGELPGSVNVLGPISHSRGP